MTKWTYSSRDHTVCCGWQSVTKHKVRSDEKLPIYTHIFLLDGAFLTIIGIWNSRASTDHTASLVRAIVTLVAYAHQGARTHIGVTDHTLAITYEEERMELHPRASTSSPLPSSCYGDYTSLLKVTCGPSTLASQNLTYLVSISISTTHSKS